MGKLLQKTGKFQLEVPARASGPPTSAPLGSYSQRECQSLYERSATVTAPRIYTPNFEDILKTIQSFLSSPSRNQNK